MTASPARRLGIVALALTIVTLGLAGPAQAAGEPGSIAGRLTDAGQPVAGASVYASAVDGDGWGYGSTDADGHYQLTDLPAGSYRVAFDAPGHASQYAYQQTEWESAAQIAVPAGGQVTVDDELLPTGTITGTFRDRAGNGMSVPVRAEFFGLTSSTNSGPDGKFTLQVLPGDYRVMFEVGSGVYQYAVGSAGYNTATVYSVAVGQTVTVDDTLLATGTIAGRFVDREGVGIADLEVSVEGTAGPSYSTTTDAAGEYRVDNVFVGSGYRVGFHGYERNIVQYAYGEVDSSDADLFTVTEGATTRVDDTLLPTGSVHFTVTDADTGAPVSAFEANVGYTHVSGVDGSATAEGVAIGKQWTYVYADGYLGSEQSRVTVTEGATTEVAISLTRTAKITTTVVDARTGAPVAGFCVKASAPTDFSFWEGCTASDADGKVNFDYLRPGDYQLFAYGSPRDEPRSKYGAQWVTADGGTGNRSLAAIVTAVPGQTVTAPTIKLDRRGTITGTIKGAGGVPATDAVVTFGNVHYYSGEGDISFPAEADGTYTVDWLGPYHWPLHFYANDHAPQWSGNSGNRGAATKIKVRAGQTVTYDIELVRGTTVTVTAPDSGWYVAYHAGTGETSGRCHADPAKTCDMLVLGPQKVRFKVWGDTQGDLWHGGIDFATATSVQIPETGTKTVTLTR
ncbi:carboxypeptidase regulatory-like domain-containing protein [Catellatospora citrea]|uniref:carboxypeptidase regulatory-like domain-containing protein n=1 Tax=Catellatospora citrea TaxID=53366 RepID=UPI0033FD2E10